MRVALRAAASLLLAVALPLLAASAAFAADPTPTPTESRIVQYTGVSTYTDTTDGSVGTAQTSATIDCSQLPCVLTALSGINQDAFSYDSLGGGGPVVVIKGAVDVQRAPAGDVCSSYYIGAGRLALSPGPTPGTLHLIRTTATSDNNNCPGSITEWDGLNIMGDLTAQSGQFCLVDGDCPTATPTPTPSATAATVPASGSAPRIVTPHAVRIADPSVLSTLPVAATGLTPANILWAAAATVVLVLLIALPSHLLNSATEAGTDRVSAWWKRTRKRARPDAAAAGPATDEPATDEPATDEPATDAAPAKPVNFAGWPLAAVGVLAASLISSFVDPSFGFNAASIRVFLSILLSFLLDAVLGWFLLILLVRRANPKATATFHFTPASLLIVVVAVLFTRLTGFAPGIVFGLVAGVAFGAIIATAEKARLAMVSLGYSFVLAIIGWAGYSAIADSVGAHPAAPVIFAQETLSSMAIGGIAALPIVLIPLRGMAGFEIFRWNRWIWASAYAMGLLSFFVVLMPKPFSWATVGLSIWTWAGIYLAYAIVAVVLWLVITRPWRKGDDEVSAATDIPVSAELADVQSPDAAAGA
jgi:hypothetical protein